MAVPIACKNEKDLIKNEAARVITRFSKIITLGGGGGYLLPWKQKF